jgi:hypothetical protein
VHSNNYYLEITMSDELNSEKGKSSKNENPLAMGIAIGIAIGAGIGVAIGNIAIGVGCGVALGVAIGSLIARKNKK